MGRPAPDDDRLSASTPGAAAETIAVRDGKTIRTRTLAATPDYRITLHEHVPAARNIVISFGLVDSGLSDKGFGSDFVINSGWDTIYVAQASNTQYQGLDLEIFAGTVTPAIGGRRVFAYGQSIGGYCALYYGGSVDARIIALAPLNSAHPPIGSRDSRMFAGNIANLSLSHGPLRNLSSCLIRNCHQTSGSSTN